MSEPPPSRGIPPRFDRLLVGGVPARLALTVLALAEAELPTALWRSGTAALAGPGHDVTDAQLLEFARSPSAEGAVLASGGDWVAAPAVGEVLPAAPAARTEIQRRLTVAWLALGRDLGWPNAPSYLLRHLPRHALAAGLADALLEDGDYLAYADLERLAPVARHARTRTGLLRGCLLELTPEAAAVAGEARTALFSVTDVLEGLGAGTDASPALYRGLWARTGVRAEHTVLTGHTDDVNAACPVLVAGKPMLATGSSDGTVRLWDPVTARLDRVFPGHSGRVRAVCAVSRDGRELLASGGEDHTVRLWDPLSGQAEQVLAGHAAGVVALCRAGEWLASAGGDLTVRVWDPATGLTVRVLETGSVARLCEARVDGRTLLASAGGDGPVRLWDPATGRLVRVLDVPAEYGMCAIDDRLLATAGADGTVRVTDLAADSLSRTIAHGTTVEALCAVEVSGRRLLALAADVGEYRHPVRLWDPASRRPPRDLMDPGSRAGAMCAVSFGGRTRLAIATANGDFANFVPGDGAVLLAEPGGEETPPVSHTDPVTSLAAVPLGRGTLLASASSDHTVRGWDLATGRAAWATRAHVTEVRAICAVPTAAGTLIASAGHDVVRLWHPETGEPGAVLRGHTGAVASVCPVTVDGQRLLASGAYNREIRLWDLDTGRTVRTLEHPGSVHAFATLELDGRTVLVSAGAEGTLVQWDPATGSPRMRLEGHETGWITGLCVLRGASALASSGSDGTVRLWDPATGLPRRVLTGHGGEVRGVCPVTVDGTVLLASAGRDAQVRLWDPATGDLRTVIPVHSPATACAEADGTLVVGLDTGLLAIRLT